MERALKEHRIVLWDYDDHQEMVIVEDVGDIGKKPIILFLRDYLILLFV